MSLLAVTDLRVEFGRRRTAVLDGVSFTLEPGQRLGLVGASGSGKTVLASAIMGLLPDNARVAGTIVFEDHELTTLPERAFAALRGRDLTMVFQEPMTALDPTMRVGRQAAELIGLHRDTSTGATRARVEQIFARMGLDQASRVADAYPHELSGGQRQRVIIAMALLNSPALVICDEPTTALDATVQARVLDLLNEELAAVNAACLFISHDLGLVSGICTDVAVLYRGQIVETGQAGAVLRAPRHPYTQGLLATADIDAVPAGERLPVIEDFLPADECGVT
ncbi:MAG: ABC transporter ATP-binding protein [Propionibacteriaceae bacterium]|jgi:ABC-type dipeptide/oligopeptide/nickel transport system ATPase component|nr:ABC transporter ATP-binding protein [Propionibacteriaceae bacterium]